MRVNLNPNGSVRWMLLLRHSGKGENSVFQLYLWSMPPSLPAILQEETSPSYTVQIIWFIWAEPWRLSSWSSFHHGAGRNWRLEKITVRKKCRILEVDFFFPPKTSISRNFISLFSAVLKPCFCLEELARFGNVWTFIPMYLIPKNIKKPQKSP